MKANRDVKVRDRKVSLKTVSVITLVYIALLVLSSSIPVFSAVSPNIYLDDYPAEAQYVIKKSGSDVWAVKRDGDIVSESSTNHSAVFDAVVDLNPEGEIYVSEGTYDVSQASIKLMNNRKYHFKGVGVDKTILDAGSTADKKVFEIVDSGSYPYWGKFITIEDLTVNAVNGYGLFCEFAAQATQPGAQTTPWFTIKNVNFGYHPSGGCKYGMKINTLYQSHFENIKIYINSATANGIGVWLTLAHPSFHCGNSDFKGLYIQSDDSTNSAVGIKVDATGAAWQSNINFVDFFRTDINNAFNKGIYFYAPEDHNGSIVNINFYGSNIEVVNNAVCLEGRTDWTSNGGLLWDILFSGGYFTAVTPINITGWSVENIICENGWILGSGDEVDTSGSSHSSSPLILRSMHLPNAPTFNIGSPGLRIRDCAELAMVLNSGTSTGTGAQQTIAHGLGFATTKLTPTRVQLTSLENETAGWGPYLSAASDATNIYVTAPKGMDYTWKAWGAAYSDG